MARTVLLLVLPVVLLTGCNEFLDVSMPSQVKVDKLQIRETTQTVALDAARFSPGSVNIIADQYLRRGKGPLSLTIGYPADSPWMLREARTQGARYKKAFHEYGVKDIKLEYVAMDDAAYAGQAVASYTSLEVEPPQDCTQIPGYHGADTLPDVQKYKFGCETKSVVSKMIANPADLLGQAGTPNDDGRRHGAVVDPYRAGVRNEPMNGITASDVGGGGK